jgi:hypothetical protein
VNGRSCPSPGCSSRVPSGRYACALDWRRLPAGHRTAILVAWGRRLKGVEGAAEAHEAAKAAADAWFAGNPR